MQSTVEVDDDLISDVMSSFGPTTKEAAVAEALKLALQIRGQASIRELRGIGGWEGDLDESRLGRNVD